MKRLLGAMLIAALAGVGDGPARGDETAAKTVVDKAVKALGGEEKLAKASTATWKSKGTMNFNGNESPFTTQLTVEGVARYRRVFEAEFNGEKRMFVSVLDGDKGWRKFGDDPMEMDAGAVANAKRDAYLQVVPATLLALKGNGFKIDSAADEKVGDKPAAVVKATGPDGKEFTLFFDKESGLPVKMSAKVAGFQGDEYNQETTYADYKDFDGIKKATKIEVKREGETFQKYEVVEFKALDKVAPDTFAEPK